MSEMSSVSEECICRLRQAAEFIQEGEKKKERIWGGTCEQSVLSVLSFLTASEGTLDFHTPTNTINWGKMQHPWGSNDSWFI